MADGYGYSGGNCSILLFVILFLLLFYRSGSYGIFPGLCKE